jgi:hypothetical protein
LGSVVSVFIRKPTALGSKRQPRVSRVVPVVSTGVIEIVEPGPGTRRVFAESHASAFAARESAVVAHEPVISVLPFLNTNAPTASSRETSL